MDTKRWLRMKEIFRGALDLAPDARRAFLNETCRDDPDLRRDIASLLSSHEKANGFLEELSETEWLALEQELPFTRIGPYLLQRIVSSGGMGTVYEAIQENPRRTVAIKVMGEGIASKSALRRFEYESQILARLTHPNIAQVIEAGTHHGNGRDRAEGTPYFVMEYIEGARSLTEYARHKELAVSERLEIFLPICDAVQHGHQKGVIHRDLKPSNLLVDSSGKVKVIDFGIARATDSDMALTTVQTDVGQLMGTLQYMSPEQCRADPNDLDVRSDVYALGVVLYELLCETLPYDVRKTAVFEAARIIRESQPKRPSTTNRALRGDVETIVLKALEKDRARRYQTVMEMGGDIRRHLHGEVILAKPAGPVTKAWKRAKRTPVLSATAGMALVSVAVFVGYILLVSYPQLKRERNIAEAETKKAIAAKMEAVEARAVAEMESDNTKKINDFLEAMLVSADPFREGREVKVREMLDKTVEMIEKEFPDRPGIEASLRNTLGTTYYNLGIYDAAEVQLSKAFELRKRIYGQYEADTLITMNRLGLVYRGQGRYSEAESLFLEALETARKKFGEEHTITLRSEHNLAWVRFDRGRYSEAEAIFRKVVEASRSALGEEDEFTLSSMNSLANMLMIRGAYPEAESILREAIETQSRILGDEHLETLLSMNSLANVLMYMGAYDEAESIYREILVIYRRVMGDEHQHTLGVMNNVANALMNQGSFSESESIHREVLAIRSRVFGEEHLETLRSMNYLALVLHKQGRLSEAESLLRELLEIRRRTLGENHPDTLMSMCNLGLLLQDQHRLGEAESTHREVLETRRRLLGEEHPETLGSRNNLALVLYRQGRFAEAESIHREVLKIRRRVQGNEHPDTLKSMSNLAVMLEKQGELAEAGSIHREVLEIRRRVLGEEHPETLGSMNNLAIILKNQGRFAEAESMHREVLATRERVLGREHPKTLSSMYNLANVLKRRDKFAEAGLLLQKVLEIRVLVLGSEHPKTLNTMHGLANVMKNQGKLAEAESLYGQLFDIIDRISQKDPYFIALLRSDYGDCLIGLRRYAEAEDSLLEAYRALKAMRGMGHKNTESVKDRLVELYEAWDKQDQAAEWRTKLEDGD